MRRDPARGRCRWSALAQLAAHVLLGSQLLAARGFEIFVEEQLLPLGAASKAGSPANESDFGSTHVDDYWSKLDDEESGLTGRQALSKHVHIGCFTVQWSSAGPAAYAAAPAPGPAPAPAVFQKLFTTGHGGGRGGRLGCLAACNSSAQVYYRGAECRCGVTSREPAMEEVIGICSGEAWEVFREYDYRSSMSPSTYDAARHLLYQIVTVRVPHVEPSIRHFIRAVDAVESTPRFEFDTRLDRMIFNAVWDFGRSRMVALSFRDWGSTLDLTVVSFNTSIGSLMVVQEHHPVQEQISAAGALLSAGLASADGMGTVDVLFGTYYTVVPAVMPGSSQVVHIIVAIDIESRTVVQSVTLPITLMNLQINALQHVLYGAGADLAGRYAYFELCRASAPGGAAAEGPAAQAAAGGKQIVVTCEPSELGALPSVVSHMYLQSASIDHQLNYAWFTYKQAAAGRPQVLEYHHDSADYSLWREDALHPEVAYASLVSPAAGPQLVFSLEPPVLLHARFSPAGDRLRLVFDGPTLRGAAPLDSDSDGVPDTWEELAEGDKVPCEWFLDDQTALALPGAMCEWASASELLAEVTAAARLAPQDEVRPRTGAIYAAGRSPSGVAIFSAPASSPALAEPPEELLVPIAVIELPGGDDEGLVANSCEELVLDGSASSGHGLRGAFVWALTGTEPPLSGDRLASLEQAFALATTADVASGTWPQVLTIPSTALVGNTTYHFSLTVTSFFDPSVSATATRSAVLSEKATLKVSPQQTARAKSAALAPAPRGQEEEEEEEEGDQEEDDEAEGPTFPRLPPIAKKARSMQGGTELPAEACNVSEEAVIASSVAHAAFGPVPPPSMGKGQLRHL